MAPPDIKSTVRSTRQSVGLTMAEDRSLEVRAVAAVFLALATVATALRCYVRLVIVKAFGWDDAIMLLALVRLCCHS